MIPPTFSTLPSADMQRIPPFRALVTALQKTDSNDELSFLFTIRPISLQIHSGAANNDFKNVALLTPGISNLTDPQSTPTGIIYIPEVGSEVLVQQIGGFLYITHFFTGPVTTTTEKDPQGERVSFNPGIQSATSRRASDSTSTLPEWTGKAQGGDVILGRGLQRVHLTTEGLFVGSDLDCCSIFTSSGKYIYRSRTEDVRLLGLHRIHSVNLGILEDTTQTFADSALEQDPTRFVTRTELLEVDPIQHDMNGKGIRARPYLVKQEGFVHPSQLDDGPSALKTGVPAYLAQSALDSHQYVIKRLVIGEPKVTGGSYSQADELADSGTDNRIIEERHWADGSYELFLTDNAYIAYDAASHIFTLVVGNTTVEATDSSVKVKSKDVVIEAQKSVTISAASEIKLSANKIELDGEVEITQGLKVNKGIEAALDIKALATGGPSISLAMHQHAGVKTGEGSTSTPTPS